MPLPRCRDYGTLALLDAKFLLQNIDGTIGRLLPTKLKLLIHEAMQKGITNVFGKALSKACALFVV